MPLGSIRQTVFTFFINGAVEKTKFPLFRRFDKHNSTISRLRQRIIAIKLGPYSRSISVEPAILQEQVQSTDSAPRLRIDRQRNYLADFLVVSMTCLKLKGVSGIICDG